MPNEMPVKMKQSKITKMIPVQKLLNWEQEKPIRIRLVPSSGY